jgi:hypothetical protein
MAEEIGFIHNVQKIKEQNGISIDSAIWEYKSEPRYGTGWSNSPANVLGSNQLQGHSWDSKDRSPMQFIKDNASDPRPYKTIGKVENGYGSNIWYPQDRKYLCRQRDGTWTNATYADGNNLKIENAGECKWTYDKEKMTMKNEQSGNFLMFDANGQLDTQAGTGNDNQKWINSNDIRKCEKYEVIGPNYYQTLGDCNKTNFDKMDTDCVKLGITPSGCNINSIANTKRDCKTYKIPDNSCTTQEMAGRIGYCSASTDKDYCYANYASCNALRLEGKECNDKTVSSCGLYKFTSSLENCNSDAIKAHEDECSRLNIPLATCTVEKLKNEKANDIARQGTTANTTATQALLDASSGDIDKIIGAVTGQSNTTSTSSTSTTKNNTNMIIIAVIILFIFLFMKN